MADHKNKEKIVASTRIDSKAEYLDPIDYSFKDLMNLQETKEMLPRYASNSKEPKKIEGKYASLSLKIGYNALADLNGLKEWVSEIFAYPRNLASLDLSFNCLTDIPQVITEFENLQCLYLHGNKIKNIEECDKLAKLNNLKSFTLHGNPIENSAGFRLYIISKLPKLKQLNFAGISKAERTTAKVWIGTYHGKVNFQDSPEKKSVKKHNSDDN